MRPSLSFASLLFRRPPRRSSVIPFQKGRQKTGGRTKLTAFRHSSKFVDQLKGGGFDYVRELAGALKRLKDMGALDGATEKDVKHVAQQLFELKFYYGELKSLLPYMAPRLREADVIVGEDPQPPTAPQPPISDEDLIKAAADEQPTEAKPRASNPPAVEARPLAIQDADGAKEDLPHLAGESEESA